MSFFGRVFKMGQAEAHSVVDKLENPIKLTEQGIRDLKVDLDKSLKAFAEVKALAIRAKREHSEAKSRAANYENKAMALLQKAESGQLDPAEADRLASEALARKEETEGQAQVAKKNMENFETQISKLDANIKKLRSNISHYENELKTLKARSKVASATKSVNKQMSKIDGGGTVSMLERMKEKVEKDEAMAEAYGDIADESKSVDEEIDSALGGSTGGSDALAALKAKMAAKKDQA